MKEYAKAHRKFSFRRLMENQHSKIQLIVTFLAILELMKMGHVHAEQEDLLMIFMWKLSRIRTHGRI